MRNVLMCVAFVAVLVSTAAAQDANETSYSGKVTDASGKPLAGAKVVAYAVTGSPARGIALAETGSAVTGADGKYAFTPKGLAAMAVIVTARKEGLASGWTDWERDRSPSEADIVLGPPASLEGTVVDESNQPVAGATVRPFLQYGEEERQRHMIGMEPADWLVARTDAKGRFQFAALPAGVQAGFLVEAAGKARLMDPAELGPAMPYTPEQKDIRLVLKVEGRIEGILARKDGKPVAGAALVARKGHDFDFGDAFNAKPATTDKDGKFTLAGLDAGEYTIRTMADKGLPEFIASREGVKVDSGKTVSDVKVEASPGGLLVVSVVNDKGKPVPGAMATLMKRTDRYSQVSTEFGTADGNGLVAFRVEPGRYSISAQAAGFRYSHGEEELAVEEGKTRQEKVELKALAHLKGVVRDEKGKPVEGATVRLPGVYGPFRSDAKTNDKGQFQIAYDSEYMRGPGRQGSAVKIVSRHVERGLAAVVEVEDLEDEVEVRLKPGITLKGLVVGEDGKPIAKAKVSAVAAEGDGPSFSGMGGAPDATTDEKGRYEVKALPPGRYAVSAWADGFGQSAGTAEAEEGKAAADAEKLTLKAAKLSVSGLVRDSAGKPVAGAMVFAHGEGQNRAGMRPAKTDKEGKFTIEKLVEGKVQINVSSGKGLFGSAEAEAGQKDLEIIAQDREAMMRGAGRPGPATAPGGEDF